MQFKHLNIELKRFTIRHGSEFNFSLIGLSLLRSRNTRGDLGSYPKLILRFELAVGIFNIFDEIVMEFRATSIFFLFDYSFLLVLSLTLFRFFLFF